MEFAGNTPACGEDLDVNTSGSPHPNPLQERSEEARDKRDARAWFVSMGVTGSRGKNWSLAP